MNINAKLYNARLQAQKTALASLSTAPHASIAPVAYDIPQLPSPPPRFFLFLIISIAVLLSSFRSPLDKQREELMNYIMTMQQYFPYAIGRFVFPYVFEFILLFSAQAQAQAQAQSQGGFFSQVAGSSFVGALPAGTFTHSLVSTPPSAGSVTAIPHSAGVSSGFAPNPSDVEVCFL